MHQMHSHEGEWNCTCPCYMQCAKCKHKISFQLNVLNQDVPSEYDMTKLLSRKKRGRPKSVPSALETSDIIDVDDDDYDDDDNIVDGVCLPCSV